MSLGGRDGRGRFYQRLLSSWWAAAAAAAAALRQMQMSQCRRRCSCLALLQREPFYNRCVGITCVLLQRSITRMSSGKMFLVVVDVL